LYKFLYFIGLKCETFHCFICEENITQYRNVLKFPSDEDLNGAAVALLRLQDTYQLDTSSVARGKLNGIQYRWD